MLSPGRWTRQADRTQNAGDPVSCPALPPCPWANCSASLGLGIPTCKMGETPVPEGPRMLVKWGRSSVFKIPSRRRVLLSLITSDFPTQLSVSRTKKSRLTCHEGEMRSGVGGVGGGKSSGLPVGRRIWARLALTLPLSSPGWETAAAGGLGKQREAVPFVQVPFGAGHHGGGQRGGGACPHGVHILRGRQTSEQKPRARVKLQRWIVRGESKHTERDKRRKPGDLI